MSKKRCNSKWNRITVYNENNIEIASYDLDELGKLECKIKTQNRRKIHILEHKKQINEVFNDSSSKAYTEEKNFTPILNDKDSTLKNAQSLSNNNNSSHNLIQNGKIEINHSQSVFSNIPEEYNSDIMFFDIDL